MAFIPYREFLKFNFWGVNDDNKEIISPEVQKSNAINTSTVEKIRSLEKKIKLARTASLVSNGGLTFSFISTIYLMGFEATQIITLNNKYVYATGGIMTLSILGVQGSAYLIKRFQTQLETLKAEHDQL